MEGHELETWMALMAGGWEVVQGFDDDGRCFLVAREAASRPGRRARLSRRETEVAALAARGSANKTIALELGIGVDAVGTYVRRVKTKLGVSSRVDLVRLLAAGAR